MNNTFQGLILTLVSLLIFTLEISGQQIPISTQQVLRPGIYNPGHATSGDLHELSADYQQRMIQISGSNSISQFLQYTNRPSGVKRAFCWGIQMGLRQEHTETLLTISPTACAKLIDESRRQLSLGISLGVANWYSSYGNRRKSNPEDLILAGTTSFLELDAGLGAEFLYHFGAFQLEAELVGSQLTGNVLSEQNRTTPLRLLPHVRASATLHYQVSRDLLIGPRLFFRNVFNENDTRQRAGTTDFGISAELPKKDMWFAASIRTDTSLLSFSALSTGFGIRIITTDTLPNPFSFRNYLDLRFTASYPLQTNTFGPNVEIGLAWSFGKKRVPKVDNFRFANPFWQREEWMTNHKVTRLDVNGPPGLEGKQETQGKKVYLTYTFPDDNILFVGADPEIRSDTLLRRIGMEWRGVDGLLENIPAEVMREALSPDSSYVKDPENIEALQKLSWIELGCRLKSDEYRIHFAVKKEYIGEVGFNNPTLDTLSIPVVFDGKDTTLAIVKNKNLSELQLAALKLHVMRKKLEFELKTYYHDKYQVRWEESIRTTVLEDVDDEVIDDRPIIWIRKLRIQSNSPHMQNLQENVIKLKFLRHPERVMNLQEGKTPPDEKEDADSAADEEENLDGAIWNSDERR